MSEITYTIKPNIVTDNPDATLASFSRIIAKNDKRHLEHAFKIVLRDKPPRMKQETWQKMVDKVIQVKVHEVTSGEEQ